MVSKRNKRGEREYVWVKKKASNGSNASYLIPKFRTKKKERNILVKK